MLGQVVFVHREASWNKYPDSHVFSKLALVLAHTAECILDSSTGQRPEDEATEYTSSCQQ